MNNHIVPYHYQTLEYFVDHLMAMSTGAIIPKEFCLRVHAHIRNFLNHQINIGGISYSHGMAMIKSLEVCPDERSKGIKLKTIDELGCMRQMYIQYCE